MEQQAEDLAREFGQAVLQGQQTALCREGFAELADMIGMFYDALVRTQVPEPLIYILTCNFAAQVTDRWILGGTGQPEERGEAAAPDVTPA